MTNHSGKEEVVLLLEETINGTIENPLRLVRNPLSPSPRTLAPLNPACVVCGQMNPRGLHLEFEAEGWTAAAQWTASAGWESFQGVIHGGVICAVMDEAMSQAIISAGYSALTAEIHVRYRNKVSVSDTLCVRGWVVSVRKRKIVAESCLISADGVEKAHAWATFLAMCES
jgi:hypothetical protein